MFSSAFSVWARGGAFVFACWRVWLRVANFTNFSFVHSVSIFALGLAGLCLGWLRWIVLLECSLPDELPWLVDCAFFAAFDSSKQNMRIFSWLRLYSPTISHATMWIKRGFVSGGLGCGGGSGIDSVAIAMSFFLMTVFFRWGVSMVTVCGEYPVIVLSGIIFHWDGSVGLGFLAFLMIVFRAILFLLYTILVLWSPMGKWSSEGLILRAGVLINGTYSESSESISGGVVGFVAEGLYWISNSSSEFPSRLQSSSLVRASCRRSLLSKQRCWIFLYDKLLSDGLVTIFEGSVLGLRPKCASNGVVLVVLLGIRRMF